MSSRKEEAVIRHQHNQKNHERAVKTAGPNRYLNQELQE